MMANNTQQNTIYSAEITPSTSASMEGVCNCKVGSCITITRRSRCLRASSSPIFNNMFLMIMLVSISYFTCCVSSWPILNSRRSFNYAPPVVVPDYYDLDGDQWALASQPDPLYELPSVQVPDLYVDPLYEEPDVAYSDPYFGPIMDTEPEEELEDLKYEQPFGFAAQEKRKASVSIPKPAASPLPSSSSPISTTATPVTTASSSNSKSSRKSLPASLHSGQKEVAMLRPPSSKSHHIQIDEPEEPKISVAQRSHSNEKPSAYDRLRQVLSLDDALKKEYQQRRVNGNRHTKRASVSSIITDSDSLTGQLNSLRKKEY